MAEEIEALRAVAGEEAVRLIRREPDPTIMAMVAGWAPRLDASRAAALGFRADTSMAEIVSVHLADEAPVTRSRQG